MFKCLNVHTGKPILILEAGWRARLDELREWDRSDRLACQGCRQPVRVRAGRRRRWHFAHRHLGNCLFDRVSPALLQARALLYRWVLGQFDPSEVDVEWHQPEIGLTRPVDMLVRRADLHCAYWLIEYRLIPALRDKMAESFAKLGIPVRILFLSRMMRPDESNPRRVFLTTTERAFLFRTSFDPLYQVFDRPVGGTAHYLSVDGEELTTYRGLHCVHKPQVFAGKVRRSALEEVSVNLETGELQHPGEMEQMIKHRQVTRRRERKISSAMNSMGDVMRKILPQGKLPKSAVRSRTENQELNDGVPRPDSLLREQAVCQFCGVDTEDWWYLDRKTGLCKCRDCLKKGLS